MTHEPTELTVQADAMRVIADLITSAASYGASKSAFWYVSEGGLITGRLVFDAEPKPCELDPWRLAIGAHSVEHTPMLTDRWFMADHMNATVREQSVRLSVVYPYTPVGMEHTGVAA